MNNNNIKNKIIFSSLVLLFFFFTSKTTLPSLKKEENEVLIHFTQGSEIIKKCLLRSIERATQSIFIKIYQITDKHICDSLIKASNKNISVELHCHSLPKTSLFFSKPNKINLSVFKKNSKNSSTFMHKKIMLIDNKIAWVSSLNFTSQDILSNYNLMVSIPNKTLCESLEKSESCTVYHKDQKIECKILPKNSTECLETLKLLITNAKQKIYVAMYVLSHSELIQSLLEAHKRGVSVKVIVNKSHAYLLSKELLSHDVYFPASIETSSKTMHHKFAWIDDSILICGSMNWTQHALKNDECCLILYNLSKEQNKVLSFLWKSLNLNKKLLPIYNPIQPSTFLAA